MSVATVNTFNSSHFNSLPLHQSSQFRFAILTQALLIIVSSPGTGNFNLSCSWTEWFSSTEQSEIVFSVIKKYNLSKFCDILN